MITIDGTGGGVFVGEAPLIPPQADNPYLMTILTWADAKRTLKVRTNAHPPEDAEKAREYHASRIIPCRTEHMFFGEGRIPIVQEMILATTDEARAEALAKLRPFQEEDFVGIFRAMHGLPVTIRLLDPPLHEFLPSLLELSIEVEHQKSTGQIDPELLRRLGRVQELHEQNPMLGMRGCRLGIEWPEIYRMQVQAIIAAAIRVKRELGDPPLVEIMIPLIGFESELRTLRDETIHAADEMLAAEGESIEYMVGTMIEVPRAALTADEIARQADFFSFGTNDLTQTTLAFSRDDAEGKFLTRYLARNILSSNPFETLDQGGVGKLIEMAATLSRGVKPTIKLGICGEHGGDPESVKFCHRAGLDYVSCSPYRVQVARIAAGQAAVEAAGARRDV